MTKINYMASAVFLASFIGPTISWSNEENNLLIMQGKTLYDEKHCGACHTIDGKKDKIGGDLGKVGAKRDAEWLERFMRQPKAVLPDATMRPFVGSEDELKALVAYLDSLT